MVKNYLPIQVKDYIIQKTKVELGVKETNKKIKWVSNGYQNNGEKW